MFFNHNDNANISRNKCEIIFLEIPNKSHKIFIAIHSFESIFFCYKICIGKQHFSKFLSFLLEWWQKYFSNDVSCVLSSSNTHRIPKIEITLFNFHKKYLSFWNNVVSVISKINSNTCRYCYYDFKVKMILTIQSKLYVFMM